MVQSALSADANTTPGRYKVQYKCRPNIKLLSKERRDATRRDANSIIPGQFSK